MNRQANAVLIVALLVAIAFSTSGKAFSGQTVPAPHAGLGSNSNYIFSADCNDIDGVKIKIHVTQDIVCQSASGPTTGFGFQLNAYCPRGGKCAYQQYVIAVFENKIVGAVDNWPVRGSNLVNDFFDLADTRNNTIPAGYEIEMSLGYDSYHNICSAEYKITDNHGHVRADVTKTIAKVPGANGSDLAPLSAFELDLVGPVNGEKAVCSSGAGTISYYSNSALTVLDSEPSCTETACVTAETTDSVYDQLDQGPSKSYTQSFTIDVTKPTIIRLGNIRPEFIVPPGRF